MTDREIVVYKSSELTEEMISADPQRYQVLANGAVYDHAVKYIVKAPPDELQPINKENARERITKRWNDYRDAAELGVVDGATAAGVMVNSTVGAWQWIVGRQTELAGDVKKGRDSTNAAKFVGQALDALADRRNSQEPPEAGATLLMSSDVAKRLLGMLAGSPAGENGDAE